MSETKELCRSDIRSFFKQKEYPSKASSPPTKRPRLENEENEGSTETKAVQSITNGLDRSPLKEKTDSQAIPSSENITEGLSAINSTSHVLETSKRLAVVIPLLKMKNFKEETLSEEEVYEVEKIVDYSWCKATMKGMYRVKWEGWASEYNTWEVIENLVDCTEKLKEFYWERLKQREKATPGRKRFLEVPPDPRSSSERQSEYAQQLCPAPCMSAAEQFMREQRKTPVKMWNIGQLKHRLDATSKQKNPSESRLNELRTQLMLRHVRRLKEDLQKRLKEWEQEVNALSSENAKIFVENEHDLEGPPRYMTYINQYKPSDGIIIPDDPPIGCECSSCDIKSEAACCPGFNGHPLAYTKFGRLRIAVGVPIYECNKKCKCGPECFNRVVQKGRKAKLCVYRTPNGCGWGVKTLENIKRGSFIVEYVGEVITSEEAEERGKKYDAEGRTYLFDLDYNLGDANPYTVDAAFYGNVSHFINHSCDPNLSIFNVWIDCLDPNLPRLCMFANRDIIKGEQITFDYRQRAAGVNDVSQESSEDENESQSKMECRCGSANCRKILFG